jgi:hypothetical protein
MICVHENQVWEIDDETIELHAMGRLKDPAIRLHIDTCKSCTVRVVDCRRWIADLKRVLADVREAESTVNRGRERPLRPEDS